MGKTVYEIRERNLIIILDGELDHHEVTKIQEELQDKMAICMAKNIWMDFQKVQFMDSAGIGLVMGAYKMVAARGGCVYIGNMTERIDRMFRLSGVYRWIEKISENGGNLL